MGRLRPFQSLSLVVFAILLLAVTGYLRDGTHKKKLPVFDAWDLLNFESGRPTVPLDLRPEQAVRIAKANRFDNRYEFRHIISHGCEGEVAIYRDMHTDRAVTVKSYYRHGNHPMAEAWSRLFYQELKTWPTEIPATLLLAGLESHHSARNLTHQGHHTFQHGLVPVLDFFIALSPITPLFPSWTSPSWHLVTPFIPDGTLSSLAITLRETEDHTLDTLDSLFRPAFTRLLSTLATIHAKGYCHDDVKPDNIFIRADRSHWLLGDLGQVRNVGHPYHQTRHWARKNQWSACEKNDVRRALKSYLAFLRRALREVRVFDVAFYGERSPLSRLYWDFVRQPVGAEEMIERSRGWEYRSLDAGVVDGDGGLEGYELEELSHILQLAVERELTCTSIHGWGWKWLRIQLELEILWQTSG